MKRLAIVFKRIMRQHPYVVATLAAIVLSMVVWSFVPKEYAAQTTIIDEYQEMDLAIGLDNVSARIKKTMGLENSGINDIEIYCRLLTSDDFAKEIAQKKVERKNVSYGKYICEEDTVEAVKKHIEYNLSTKKQSAKIQFTDKDPIVAAQMLDSVVAQLQADIDRSRQRLSSAAFENAKRERNEAAQKYHDKQKEYAEYVDTHTETASEAERQQIEALGKEQSNAFKEYQNATQKYVRYKSLMERKSQPFAVMDATFVPTKTHNHYIGYLLSFVTIALLSVKCYFLSKKFIREKRKLEYGNVFSPWALSILIWCGEGVFYIFVGDMMDPVKNTFFYSLFVWLCIIVGSSFITFNLLPKRETQQTSGIETNNFFFNLFFVLALIMTPLYVYQIYKLVTMFDTKDLVANIRMLAIEGDGYGFLNYTMIINQSLLLVALWRYPKIPLWKLLCTILCCIVFAIANMEKLTFFLVFICVAYVLFERKFIKVRTIVIFASLLILLFYFFTISRTSEDSNAFDDYSLLDFIGMYLMSSPVAFGHLRPTISPDFFSESLWTIYSYAGRFLGTAAVAHDNFGEFVYVPMATNVYTIMKPFYQDGGIVGVGFFALIYGVVSGTVYRYAKNGKPFSICLYTYIVFILVLQFFDELVFAALQTFAERALMIWIVCQTKFKLSLKKYS